MIRVGSPRLKTKDTIRLHLSALLTGAKEVIKPGTITIQYPRERRWLPDNFRGYILLNPGNCISCFQCSFVCPANAILMKKSPNNRYYPSIDYAKCIFCHFCVDSCPGSALRQTKIHDVAYKDMEEMFCETEEMVNPPEIWREDESTIRYEMEYDIVLKRIKEKDELIPEFKVVDRVKEVSVCIDTESCLACGICSAVCPMEAISVSVEGTLKRLRINPEKCTGCGLCVKECPVQILRLSRV
jgi:NADH-quinone oxidoreductase subunit I